MNVRAAKALGWFVREHKTGAINIWVDENSSPIEAQNLFVDNRSYYLFEDDTLRFTTSYDWAMLGVKKLTTNQLVSYMFKLCGLMAVKLGIDNLLEISETSLTILLLKTDPKEITQAWVEVLEAEND